jgi:hypothetical protein
MACDPVSVTSQSIQWNNVKEAIPGGTHMGICCVGNGTTDDTVALQAWIDFATGTGMPLNPVIYLPPGKYLISDSITISKSCTILSLGQKGAGLQTALVVADFNFDAIQVSGVSGAYFYGFKIEVSGTPLPPNSSTTGNGFKLTNCTDVVIEDVAVLSHWHGIIADTCHGLLLRNVHYTAFNHATVPKGSRHGFRVSGGGDARFFTCSAVDKFSNDTVDGFVVANGFVGAHLFNCGTTRCYRGFYSTKAGGTAPDDMTLVNFSTGDIYGVYLDAGGNVTLSASYISIGGGQSGDLGAIVTSSNFAGRLSMLGNFVGSLTSGVQILGGKSCSIVGGTMSRIGSDALFLNSDCTVTLCGVFLQTNSGACLHLGSSQRGSVSVSGVSFSGGLLIKGVLIDNGCSAAIDVTGCSIASGMGPPLTDGGTNSARRYAKNVGLNPHGNATPTTFPNTGQGVPNSTGFDVYVYISGGTVDSVAVNGVLTGRTRGAFRVAVSETITISYSVQPTWLWWAE